MFQFLKIFLVMPFLLISCTGDLAGIPSSQKGGMIITPGDSLTVDLQDLVALNFQNFYVDLKSISSDFGSSKKIYDLNSYVKEQLIDGSSSFQLTLPKSIGKERPILIVVDVPAINYQFVDVIFSGQDYVRPGIASTLAFNLMKYYGNLSSDGSFVSSKNLNQYNSVQFGHVRSLIQEKIDSMTENSENLSWSSTPFDKLLRFFTNGLANNIQFLTSIQQDGIVYSWTVATPPGLIAENTPENSLDGYRYAVNFKINNVQSRVSPFNHTNSPSELVSGATFPQPSKNISAMEGARINVRATGHDPEEDFIDKNFIVDYIPRVLPAGTQLFIPEPQASNQVISDLNSPEQTDVYTSDPIQYNEALDLEFFNLIDPNTRTAYRNLYFLVTDGMLYIPYRWNFKYINNNRAPQFFERSADPSKWSDISYQNYFDSQLIPQGEIADSRVMDPRLVGKWFQHASHCEPETNQPDDVAKVLPITERKHGPWSCTFKLFDPDLDDDPNAPSDQFWISLSDLPEDVKAEGGFLASSDGTIAANMGRIWPHYPHLNEPQPTRQAMIISDSVACKDNNSGIVHRRCGIGLVKIKVDNSVDAVAGTQRDSTFSYRIIVRDRPLSVGGMATEKKVSRVVRFVPIPPRLVNFASENQIAAVADSSSIKNLNTGELYTLVDENSANKTYRRWETFFGELVNEINNYNQSMGFTSVTLAGLGFSNINLGTANRNLKFRQGTPQAISNYVTEPYQAGNQFINLDINPILGTPVEQVFGTWLNFSLLGNLLGDINQGINFYSYPRQYDNSCRLSQNNQDLNNAIDPWNQQQSQGWWFEINAIDYSNIGLAPGERADPVNISLSNDVNLDLNSSGLVFCDYNEPRYHVLYGEHYITNPLLPPGQMGPINAETCRTTNDLPTQMQPIPIYYEVFDSNNQSVIQKLVYHRLRMRWQPKNHLDVTNGQPPLGYIQNLINNIKLSGSRRSSQGDTFDETMPSPIRLMAEMKNMSPCVLGLNPAVNTTYSMNKNNKTSQEFNFVVSDENRTLGSSRVREKGALLGRYEAEATVQGNRGIRNQEILKFIPFVSDCHFKDPVGMQIPPASPVYANSIGIGIFPNPLKSFDTPIFYSRRGDNAEIPRIRLQSTSVDPLNLLGGNFSNAGSMCLQMNWEVRKIGNNPINEVLLIDNIGAISGTVNLQTTFGLPANCVYNPVITVSSDQKFIAIPSSCGSSHTLNQSLSSTDANLTMVVQSVLTPESFGFPSINKPYSMEIFPQLYQAVSGTNPNAVNAFHLLADPIDTFFYDVNNDYLEKYTGYGNWVASSNPNNVGFGAPVFLGPIEANINPTFQAEYIDFDDQPNSISLHSTPIQNGDVYYMKGTISNSIQVYVKNHATAQVDFQVSDSNDVPVSDPFDISSFALTRGTSPDVAVSAPSLVGFGPRQSCVDAPTNYPAVTSLNYNSLRNYDRCRFQWSPASCTGIDCISDDDGKRFSYTLDVQDNRNATENTFGIGGRYPDPNSIVQSALGERNNGKTVKFTIIFESLEPNRKPYFITENLTQIQDLYSSTGGSGAWNTVFPGGIQTSYATPTGLAGNNYTQELGIQNDDVLINSVPIELTEGMPTQFLIRTKDDNNKLDLRTILMDGGLPEKVLLIHNGGTSTYSLASGENKFVNLQYGVNDALKTTELKFSFTPTDVHARYLSSNQGFLIPVNITDKEYKPNTTDSFPASFTVTPKKNRGWIWAKLKVTNTVPLVENVVNTNAKALESETLVFETGQTKTYSIRISDIDSARWSSGNANGFNPILSDQPAFMNTVNTSFSLVYNPNTKKIEQTFTISGTPSNSDIGLYTNSKITITDPGDPSLGYNQNPDPVNPTQCNLLNGNTRVLSFKVLVKGKPIFLVPKPSNSEPSAPSYESFRAFAYSRNPFYFPLSLNVSRSEEKLKPFFMGIDFSSTVSGMKKEVGVEGYYVNQNHVLTWSDPKYEQVLQPPLSPIRTVPIIAVLGSKCLSSAQAGGKTIVRFVETANGFTREFCHLSSSVFTADAATQNLNLHLVSADQMLSNLPSLAQTEAKRIRNTLTPGQTDSFEIDNEFADFRGRCVNCFGTMNGSFTGSANSDSGSVFFQYNGFVSRFDYFKNPNPFKVEKTYQDTNPMSTQSQRGMISISSFEGETIKLSAGLNSFNSAFPLHYRWYVNGCLKSAGLVSNGNSVTYDLQVSDLSSGANNDCSGQHSILETDSGQLGRLLVRLQVGNGTEPMNSSNLRNYLWSVRVLNTQPNLMTASIDAYPPSDQVKMNTMITGTANVDFAMPVYYSDKSFFAFTDRNTASGLSVRFRELTSNGSMVGTTDSMTLNCKPSNVTTKYDSRNPLKWIGIQPLNDGNLAVSASSLDSYRPDPGYYTSVQSTCFNNKLKLSAPVQSSTYFTSNSSIPAEFLAFSKHVQSTKPTAVYYLSPNMTNWPPASSSDRDMFFFVESNKARSLFWTYDMLNMFSSVPAEISSFSSNIVRRNIISGNSLFQLIGQNSVNASVWRGFIKVSGLTGVKGGTNTLTANPISSIAFADPSENVSGITCGFKGTPLTGVYHSADDILYVLASSSSSGNPNGKLIQIKNATTQNPSCHILANNLVNPSTNEIDFNPNITKMILDPERMMIYGIIVPVAGLSSQFYSIDLLTQKVATANISSSIVPHTLIYSPKINALQVFDNRKSSPALYKIW